MRAEGLGIQQSRAASKADTRPLVAHLLYRFDIGGLENGIVNLINHMPADAYRHVVVSLTEVAPAMTGRVTAAGVEFVALHKPPGQGIWHFPKVTRALRALRPAILHTRNLAALEMQLPGAWSRVPVRIHGEHGWDVGDLDGSNRANRLTRRVYAPFVHHWIALSRDLERYLNGPIGLAPARVTRICNGVDERRFRPARQDGDHLAGCPFNDPAQWLVGTVGRMQAVKNQTALARAFARALELAPHLRDRMRLVMVGEGPLRAAAESVLAEARVSDLAWLPGERADVADVMRSLDCFVLPSLSEGISNTILEAMATALPVVATSVGGNGDLVVEGVTGYLVPPDEVEAMATKLVMLAGDPERARAMGAAGRAAVDSQYGLGAMVAAYQGVYDRLLSTRGVAPHRG